MAARPTGPARRGRPARASDRHMPTPWSDPSGPDARDLFRPDATDLPYSLVASGQPLAHCKGTYAVRKILVAVLVGLGVFGLLAAGLLRFYAPSRAEKTPLNLDIKQVATGPAKVLNAATGSSRTPTLHRHPPGADRLGRLGLQGHRRAGDAVHRQGRRQPAGVRRRHDPQQPAGQLHHRPGRRRPQERRVGQRPQVRQQHQRRHHGHAHRPDLQVARSTPRSRATSSSTRSPGRPGRQASSAPRSSRASTCTSTRRSSTTIDLPVGPGIPGKYSDTRTVWVEPLTGAIVKGVEHQSADAGRRHAGAGHHADLRPGRDQLPGQAGQGRPVQDHAADRDPAADPACWSGWSRWSGRSLLRRPRPRRRSPGRPPAQPPVSAQPARSAEPAQRQPADEDRGAGQQPAAQRRPLAPLLRRARPAIPVRPGPAAGNRPRPARGPGRPACGGARRRWPARSRRTRRRGCGRSRTWSRSGRPGRGSRGRPSGSGG